MSESDLSRSSFDSRQRGASIDSRRPSEKRPTEKLTRFASASSSSTLTSAPDNLTFKTDSEDYGSEVRKMQSPEWEMGKKGPRLTRVNTMTGTKKEKEKGAPSKWGYGWGLGKRKEVEAAAAEAGVNREMSEKSGSRGGFPLYDPPVGPIRTDTRSTNASRATQESRATHDSRGSRQSKESQQSKLSAGTMASAETKVSSQSRTSQRSTGARASAGSGTRGRQTPLVRNDSNSTLVGSALDRKINDVEPSLEKADTAPRLDALRELMQKDELDY